MSGLPRADPPHRLARIVNDDERKVLAKTPTSELGVFLPCAASLFRGRTAWVSLISESGLYKFIMRSDKPTARPFQDWVTREVLPGDQEGWGLGLDNTANTVRVSFRAWHAFCAYRLPSEQRPVASALKPLSPQRLSSGHYDPGSLWSSANAPAEA